MAACPVNAYPAGGYRNFLDNTENTPSVNYVARDP